MVKNSKIGNITIDKELLVDLLGDRLGDRQISKVYPVTPFRENTSPHSDFYTFDVEFKDSNKQSFFIKRVSDKRRELSDKLPTSGKLVETEIKAYELSNGSGTSPEFYGFREDSVEEDGQHIKHTLLFLEQGGESSEGFFSNFDMGVSIAKQQVIFCLNEASDLILSRYKEPLYQAYNEEEKLQVCSLSRQIIEGDIKQAFSNLLFYKFGKGNQVLTPHQTHSMCNWMERYDYKKIIATCAEHIVKYLSPTEEDLDEKGKDKRPLFDLDLHPGQLIKNKKTGKWFKIDDSKFGFGPLSLIPASLLYHPSVIGKFSYEGSLEVADHVFKQSELNEEESDLYLAKKRRFDEQFPAAVRYSLFRAMSYVTGLKNNYPKSLEALVENSPIWDLETCLPLLVNCFIGLEDTLTPYIKEAVHLPLNSFTKTNGS